MATESLALRYGFRSVILRALYAGANEVEEDIVATADLKVSIRV